MKTLLVALGVVALVALAAVALRCLESPPPTAGSQGANSAGDARAGQVGGEIAAERRAASAATIVGRWLRFVADGETVHGVRLVAPSKKPSFAAGAVPLAAAAADGLIACGALRGDCIAHVDGFVPVAVALDEWQGVRDVAMRRGLPLTVWCVDDCGAPLEGCIVALQSRQAQPALPALDGTAADDNPLVDGVRQVRVSDASGRAPMLVEADAELCVRVVHPWYVATAREVLEGTAIDARAGVLHVRLAPARGVIAQPPPGVTIDHWHFAVTPRSSERAGYGLAAQIAARLRRDHPTCGVRVLPQPARADEPPQTVLVHAQANDGSLWSRACAPQRLTPDVVPVPLAPATGSLGWLRVEVSGQVVDLRGTPLLVVGGDGRGWACTSGRAIQLPVGTYKIFPELGVPGLDEIFAKVTAAVVPGDIGAATVVHAAMPVAVGRVDVTVVVDDGSPDVASSLCVVLANGDSMVAVDFRGGSLALPVGTHEVTVSAVGYEPSKRAVTVAPNQVVAIRSELAALR